LACSRYFAACPATTSHTDKPNQTEEITLKNSNTRHIERLLPYRPACILLIAVSLLAGVVVSSGCGQDTSGNLLTEVTKRGTVRVGIRRDDPPHSEIDAKGTLVGFDVDIARSLARRLGVKLEIVPVDELTRISYLQNGKIDLAVTSISHTVKRDRQIDFSKTYFFSKQTFLVKASSGITTLQGLVGKPVGATRGSNSVGNWKDWLKSHGYPSDIHVTEFGDKQAAVDAVKSGAIAGYTEDAEVLISFVKHNRGLRVLLNEGTGPKLDGVGTRQNQSSMLDAVNFALQDIATSGEYSQIYNRWFGQASSVPLPLQGHIEVWPAG
jgi:polar amino acid transport system substrate-binding protein